MPVLPMCEDGKLQGRKRNVELAAYRAMLPNPPVVPVGLAVRLGDVHLMTLVASPATFGLQITKPTPFEAPLLLFTPEIGEACKSIDPGRVRGKIVMVDRGTCTFAEKALRLQNAGAAGVIVIDSSAATNKYPSRRYSLADDTLGLGRYVTIPIALVAHEDVAQLHWHVALETLLSANGTQSEADEVNIDGASVEGDDALTGSLSPWLF